jgi:hypothetical protein
MRFGQAFGLGLAGFLLGGTLVAIVCIAVVLPILLWACYLARPDTGVSQESGR